MGQIESAVEVKDKEEQRREPHTRTINDLSCDVRNEERERKPRSDRPHRHDPGMNAKQAKPNGVDEFCTGGDDLEEVTIRNLPVKDAHSARKEQTLVVGRGKRSCRQQKCPQVKEHTGSSKKKRQVHAGKRRLRLLCLMPAHRFPSCHMEPVEMSARSNYL